MNNDPTHMANKPNYAAYRHLLEQHVTDAAFLWLLRAQAVNAADYRPAEITELDNRINTHLDAIHALGEPGWEACKEQLELEEPGEVFVATVIAFQSTDAAKIKQVCETGLSSPETTKALVSAAAWVEPAIAQFWAQRFLNVSDPRYRYLGLAICSARRDNPGPALQAILQDADTAQQPEVHARALRLIGELKLRDSQRALDQGIAAEDPVVKFWAHWSAVLLGNSAAANQLLPYVFDESPLQRDAVQAVFSVLPLEQARAQISMLVKNAEHYRIAIEAISVLGDPHAIPWLIGQMTIPESARLAADAFSDITGLDIVEAGYEAEPPDGFQAGPAEDPEDEDVAMDPDEDLPWPDIVKIKAYWQQHQPEFQNGQRYLAGRPVAEVRNYIGDANLNQKQRRLAALHLTLLEPQQILLNTKAQPA